MGQQLKFINSKQAFIIFLEREKWGLRIKIYNRKQFINWGGGRKYQTIFTNFFQF
jgi:hypothetical protein